MRSVVAMKWPEAFCHRVDKINEQVGKYTSFLMAPLVFIVVADVLLRYIFAKPIIWAWDVNIQLLGTLTILGGGYAHISNGHVSVDVITSMLSARGRAIIDVVTSAFFFLGIGVMLWQTAVAAWASLLSREAYTSIFMTPIYPFKMLMIVGVFLLLLQGIAKFIRDLAVAFH